MDAPRRLLLALILLVPGGCADAGPKTGALAATRRSAAFEGEVRQGDLFARGFGDDFTFMLRASDHGWWIDVRDERGTEDLSLWTPPWHAPNPRELEGWHLRNADNTGPNGPGPKNLNVPQHERNFIFSTEVGRTIPGGGRYPSSEEVERMGDFGRGTLRILDYRLVGLQPGQRARFAWMKFRVELTWARD